MRFVESALTSLLSAAVLAVTVGFSAPAEAQVLATDPEPPSATVVVPLPSVPSPGHLAEQPEPTATGSQWYGDNVLIAGAITVPLMVGNISAAVYGEGDLADVGIAYGVLSSAAHVISGAAIQAGADGDRHGYKIGVSAALRTGLMATSETTALVICNATDSCSDGVFVGAFAAGAALPVLLEATILSWKGGDEERAHTPRPGYAVPYAAPTQGGAKLGVAGAF